MVTVLILLGILAGVVGLDQLTKFLTVSRMEVGESFAWIRGVVHFTFVKNEGAAFGMFSDHRWVFMVFSTVAIVGLCVYLFRYCDADWWIRVPLAFVIGGGIGNMIDRIAFGAVVDFIELPFLWLPLLNTYFPVFNVADSFVTVGVVMLAARLIRLQVLESRAEKQAKREREETKEEDHGENG